MADVRTLNKEKYEMSENRFRELYYFCLQYPEWKKELAYQTNSLSGGQMTGMPYSHKISDSTQKLAMRRVELKNRCELIEQTVEETESCIYQFLLKAVTSENITYNYLKTVLDIPCGKKLYYDRRRKFYWLLSQKK